MLRDFGLDWIGFWISKLRGGRCDGRTDAAVTLLAAAHLCVSGFAQVCCTSGAVDFLWTSSASSDAFRWVRDPCWLVLCCCLPSACRGVVAAALAVLLLCCVV
jgi:hypothetical protein